MVNKKIVIIVTIIAIIVASGIVYISLNKEFQEQYTFSEETAENKVENNVEEKNQVEENVVEENEVYENKVEENKVENEVDNEIEEENKVSNTTSDNKYDEKKDEVEKLTGKDRAIDLVKKEWGENDNTVYYYVEEQVSDNVYIISVRDQSTTEDLSSYKVDVSSNSVEKD